MAEAQTHLDGLLQQRNELELRAPASGIVQFSRHLAEDHWLQPEQELFFIFEPGLRQIVSFVDEAQMHRVKDGAEAKFIAHDGVNGGFAARLISIDETAIEKLDYPELSSINSGEIAVHAQSDGSRTVDAHYKLRAELVSPPKQITANILGTLHIQTAPYAPMASLWRRSSALLLRESGF